VTSEDHLDSFQLLYRRTLYLIIDKITNDCRKLDMNIEVRADLTLQAVMQLINPVLVVSCYYFPSFCCYLS